MRWLTDAESPLAVWGLSLAEARSQLAFHRSRAPSFGAALSAWARGMSHYWRRPAAVGWRAHWRLMRLERACFDVGLFLGTGRPAFAAAPWHLPPDIETLPVEALPAHPAIDLRAAAAQAAAEPTTTAAALLRGLMQGPATEPWHSSGESYKAAQGPEPRKRVAVCLHLFYPALWPEIHATLKHLPEPWDLFVTLPSFALTPTLADIAKDCPGVRFFPAANRGRDVLPWVNLLSRGTFDRYELVCKLHTKVSPHTDSGHHWRRSVLDALIGPPANARALLSALRADTGIGVLGPSSMAVGKGQDRWAGNNAKHLRRLENRLQRPPSQEPSTFFAGSMFWFRPAALGVLASWGLSDGEFEPELGQSDGTLAHALERFIDPLVQQAGYRVLAWDPAHGQCQELARPTVPPAHMAATHTVHS